MATMTLSDSHDGKPLGCKVSIVVRPAGIGPGLHVARAISDDVAVLSGSCSLFDSMIAALEGLKPWVRKNEAGKTK